MRFTFLKFNYEKNYYSNTNVAYHNTTLQVKPIAGVPLTEKCNSSYMYIYICIYIHIHIIRYIHTYKHKCVCVCVCVYRDRDRERERVTE